MSALEHVSILQPQEIRHGITERAIFQLCPVCEYYGPTYIY